MATSLALRLAGAVTALSCLACMLPRRGCAQPERSVEPPPPPVPIAPPPVEPPLAIVRVPPPVVAAPRVYETGSCTEVMHLARHGTGGIIAGVLSLGLSTALDSANDATAWDGRHANHWVRWTVVSDEYSAWSQSGGAPDGYMVHCPGQRGGILLELSSVRAAPPELHAGARLRVEGQLGTWGLLRPTAITVESVVVEQRGRAPRPRPSFARDAGLRAQ